MRDPRAVIERGDRVFEARDAHAERVEFVLEGVDELLQLVEVGLRRRSGAVRFDLRDRARDDRGHLVARERTVALERTVGISVDQAVGGQRLDRLVGPVVRRHVGQRRGRGAQRQPGKHGQPEPQREPAKRAHHFRRG